MSVPFSDHPRWPAGYVVRPMRVEDIAAVLAVERLSLPTPWKAKGYRHELTTNKLAHYWVLVVAGQLVGYAGYWLVGPEAQISIIALHPDQQGRGLGTLLLLHILADVAGQGATEATLEVRRSNIVARKLYTAHGFLEVGLRQGYYKDTGEDAILMTLNMAADDFSARWQKQYTRLSGRLSGEGL